MNLSEMPLELMPGTAERSLPAHGRLPLSLLAALGERIAAGALALQAGSGGAGELARLERLGLQLQSLAQVVTRAPQLRHEPVDLGLALLQTQAEWSAEAHRLGAELHGPACSVQVDANPAALKHLLDLLIEHALQQGRHVRLDIEDPAGSPFARVVAQVAAAPRTQSPARDTLAWQLLAMLARALVLVPERHAVEGGERLVLSLPRGALAGG